MDRIIFSRSTAAAWLLSANKVTSGVESMRREGPRDPGCGAQGVTLFQEIASVKHLFWKVFESFGSVCVHTAVPGYTCMGVYACVVRVGLLGVTVSLENFSGKYLFFIVHSNYAA